MSLNPQWAVASELQEYGCVVLRGVADPALLNDFQRAAGRLFAATASLPTEYRFTEPGQAALVTALRRFGVPDVAALLPPDGLPHLIDGVIDLQQSWVRRRFAPGRGPRWYQPNSWHQDGGLGVRFPLSPSEEMPPMTPLLTCWIPLQACGEDSPGLELLRLPLDKLLHFTELADDDGLRRRFGEEAFWSPSLAPGDLLLFLNGTLHRTHIRPEMQHDRLSVEYRFFPDLTHS